MIIENINDMANQKVDHTVAMIHISVEWSYSLYNIYSALYCARV